MVLIVYTNSGRRYRYPNADYYYVRDTYVKVSESKSGETIAYVGIDNIESVMYEDKDVEVEPISSNIQER